MADLIAMSWAANDEGIGAMQTAANQLGQQADEVLKSYQATAAHWSGAAAENAHGHVQRVQQARTNLNVTLMKLRQAVEAHTAATRNLDMQQALHIGGVS